MVQPASTQTPSSNGNTDGKLAVESLATKLTFGQMVRQIREAHALTQVTVSSRAEISPGYIGLIETEKRASKPTLDLVKSLAHACEATLAETEALWRVAGFLAPGVSLTDNERTLMQDAIESDPFLDERGKQTMLDVYRALVPRYWT